MGKLKDGFYKAHLEHHPEGLLCYVYTNKSGEPKVIFPRTGPFPVLEQPVGHLNYVLALDLRPASPAQELDEALNMVRFIHEHTSRLQERKSQLEAVAST